MAAYPKKWVISWISFHDNTLKMDFRYATSEDHALRQAFKELTGVEHDSDFDLDIKNAAFDCDGMIGAVQDYCD